MRDTSEDFSPIYGLCLRKAADISASARTFPLQLKGRGHVIRGRTVSIDRNRVMLAGRSRLRRMQ